MEKFSEAYELLKGQMEIETPIRLRRSDIERAHSPAYLDAVNFDLDGASGCGLLQYDRNRLGLPADAKLLQRSMLETAGTVSATLAALNGGFTANLAGGTHHAFPDRGLGFCVLNDIAVSVEYLGALDKRPAQILIVDTDAHQGNANHAYFHSDATCFTYSIHVGKNYPAKKEPGDLDVGLERYVPGPAYLKQLKQTLPRIFEKTEPDLVFWISGADCHEADRFGQMKLTTEDMSERDRFVCTLCREYDTPTVVVYGGGYNRMPGMTAALHAQSIRIAQEIS